MELEDLGCFLAQIPGGPISICRKITHGRFKGLLEALQLPGPLFRHHDVMWNALPKLLENERASDLDAWSNRDSLDGFHSWIRMPCGAHPQHRSV